MGTLGGIGELAREAIGDGLGKSSVARPGPAADRPAAPGVTGVPRVQG